jgi:hypothetical protein
MRCTTVPGSVVVAVFLIVFIVGASEDSGEGPAGLPVALAVFLVSYFNMRTRIANAFALPPDERHPYDPSAILPLLRCSEK